MSALAGGQGLRRFGAGVRAPQTLGILLVLILMGAILSFTTTQFLTTDNLLNVARQVSLVVIVGMGMTFLLTSGGLDISVGSVVAFTGCLAAGLSSQGWPLVAAFAVATLAGGGIGSLHGSLVVWGRMSPIIVTLGTLFAVRGGAFLYTQAVAGSTEVTNVPDGFGGIGAGHLGRIPIPVVIAVGLVVVFYALFSKSLLGKYTRAIGGNVETARLSGIRTGRVLLALYTVTGLLAGFSGVLLASSLYSGQPSAADGFEFDVIIAVLIGGTSLFGGKGTIVGTVIGALIIGVLNNGSVLLGIDSYWQEVVKGIVLVFAVLVDARIRARRGLT